MTRYLAVSLRGLGVFCVGLVAIAAVTLAKPAAASEPELLISTPSSADPLEIAVAVFNERAERLSLEQTDLEHRISDSYRSQHNQLTHVYLQQQIDGIPVHTAITTVNVMADGRVLSIANRFLDQAQDRISGRNASLDARDALAAAAAYLGTTLDGDFVELQRGGGAQQSARFNGNGLSDAEIPVELVYERVDDQLRLAWRMVLDRHRVHTQHLDMRIDAASGEVIGLSNWVSHMGVPGPDHSASYRVFAVPFESPEDVGATHELVTDPWDLEASPRGWQDSRSDGSGFQFADTRGNNVLAQADLNATNSSNTRPTATLVEGNLVFDTPWDPEESPLSPGNVDASVVNLFYWNNMLHDVLWHYGFNEAAGNFQSNNFGRGGNGNDAVRADALDGNGTNNANFNTPPDGSPGRMQMYRWLAPSTISVNILTPFEASYSALLAGFGPNFATPVENQIVVVDDGNGNFGGQQGCSALVNAAEVAGKIALIRRGECEFGAKALNAQSAGAIAAIIYNNQGNSPMSMGAGAAGGQVTIPTVSIGQEAGETLAATEGEINAEITPPGSAGPDRDSDFDAGIIAHEYGHGLSNRLTGGPSQSGCLSGATEQAGEGWSDYLGLIMTMKPNSCSVPAAIGTYPSFQGLSGQGIRRYRYTRDMTINPFTYEDISSTQQSVPHGVGTVWATTVWDMTCDLVDEYGFDADLKTGTGGNNIAMQLVTDGLKLQACRPTFVDARNAILAADVANNDGANRCTIWRSFARRGLGLSADAGTNNRGDETEAFDLPEDCELSDEIFNHGFEAVPAP